MRPAPCKEVSVGAQVGEGRLDLVAQAARLPKVAGLLALGLSRGDALQQVCGEDAALQGDGGVGHQRPPAGTITDRSFLAALIDGCLGRHAARHCGS